MQTAEPKIKSDMSKSRKPISDLEIYSEKKNELSGPDNELELKNSKSQFETSEWKVKMQTLSRDKFIPLMGKIVGKAQVKVPSSLPGNPTQRSRLSFAGKWSNIKGSFAFQKNTIKAGIIAGIVSTTVLTFYTMLAMKLQRQEMIKNELDIKIKTCELERLRRELYPEEEPIPIELTVPTVVEKEKRKGWIAWVYSLAYDLPENTQEVPPKQD